MATEQEAYEKARLLIQAAMEKGEDRLFFGKDFDKLRKIPPEICHIEN